MAKAYSIDLRERVVAAVAEGMPLAEAAKRFRVSVASIVRWRALERRRGSARPKPFGGGRRAARTEAAREAILALLEENPDLTTEALRVALAARGLVFGYGSLYRFRRRHGPGREAGRGEEPAGEAREAVFALLRGNPGLSTRALRAALAERGFTVGYGVLYRFLRSRGFKGNNSRHPPPPAGPKAIAADLRERILEAVAEGMSNADAGQLFRVNPVTIARWRARIGEGESAGPGPAPGKERADPE